MVAGGMIPLGAWTSLTARVKQPVYDAAHVRAQALGLSINQYMKLLVLRDTDPANEQWRDGLAGRISAEELGSNMLRGR